MTLKRPNFLRRWLGEHARVCVAAFGRQWRDPIGTLLTSLVIGITLALPAGLDLLVQNLRTAAGGLNQTRTMTVFLRDGQSESDGRKLTSSLARRDEFAAVAYTSRDQALADFRARTDLGAVLDALDSNPLPASISLTPRPALAADDLVRLAQDLRKQEGVEQVLLDNAWIQRLSTALALASRLALLLAVALGTAAVLAMGNTIRLDIEARRDEIVVMKLIGAPAGFIRRPFLYAGFWYGLSGGVVAIIAVYIARYAMAAPVQDLVALYQGAFDLRGPDPRTLASVLGAGAVLGLAGAWLAVSRHLGRVEQR
ncbi:MAG: permease-like cell division protein FtsX [Panacagrimonas sp.]